MFISLLIEDLMDDKTKKRIELIKKYNKNIFGEELEKN